jgi:hypothetical protein
MSGLGQPAQAAVARVAKRVSGTWEAADGGSPDGWLTIDGKRIAVDVVTLDLNLADRTRPRLRFDRVVLGLFRRLRAGIAPSVPDGDAVLITVTAPIRLPAQTAAALEDRVRDGLAKRPTHVEIDEAMCGNQVRARVVKDVSRRTPKVIGFVHNPDSDADLLLDLTQAMLQQIGAAADKRPPAAFTGDRWLVVVHESGLPHPETYRHIYATIADTTDFNQVLLVLAGRVENLA